MTDNTYYLAGVLAQSSEISELLARTREIIAASKELLAKPAQSTFLGLSSFEPFAQEDEQPFEILSVETTDV